MTPKKILFITHDSSRSGAPMLLLHLLKWLKGENAYWNIDVLTLKKGALDAEFESVADTFDFYFDKNVPTFEYYQQKFFNKGFNAQTYCLERFYKKYQLKKYDVIYTNSVISIPVASKVKNFHPDFTKLLCNVHELPTIIDLHLPNFIDDSKDVDLFVAGSNLVATSLQENYQISNSKTKVLYDFTDIKKLPEYAVKSDSASFVVGGMGTTHWRKGHDLFLMIAIYIKKNFPDFDIQFVWMGSQPNEEKIILKNDLKKIDNAAQFITFRPSETHYENFYKEIDLFALTSKEDPFPLVAVEAGAYGLPIICFENATGINEILRENNGGGFSVPYLDIEEFAKKIIFYYENRKKLEEDSTINKKSFSEFTVEKAGPKLLKILEEILK